MRTYLADRKTGNIMKIYENTKISIIINEVYKRGDIHLLGLYQGNGSVDSKIGLKTRLESE